MGVCPGTHGSRAWLAELSRGVGMEEVSIADEASAAAEADAAAEEEETMATRLQGAGVGGAQKRMGCSGGICLTPLDKS